MLGASPILNVERVQVHLRTLYMYNNIVLEQVEHYFVKGILDFESHSTGYIIVHSDQRFWL